MKADHERPPAAVRPRAAAPLSPVSVRLSAALVDCQTIYTNGLKAACEFYEPRCVEDAIAFAIWTVWEMTHPELDGLLRTIH